MIHRVRTIRRDVHLEDRPITLTGHGLNRDPSQREIFRKLMVVDVKVNKIAHPLRRNFHYWLLAPSLQLLGFYHRVTET